MPHSIHLLKHLAQVGAFLFAFIDLLKEVAICTLLSKVQMHQAEDAQTKSCTMHRHRVLSSQNASL